MKKIILVILCFCTFGCKKYLELRPDKALVVLSTVQDAQAMLDYSDIFNRAGLVSLPLASDDHYSLYEDLQAASQSDYNVYIWGENPFNQYDRNDWSKPYVAVYYANIVLDALGNNEIRGSLEQLDNLRGQSLFLRSMSFYNLLQIFAKPYFVDGENDNELGIPLRLSSDFNIPTVRSTVKVCYNKILNDLKESIDLLPESVSSKTRVSKSAGYALLARVSLNIEDYYSALHYSNLLLQKQNNLLDYNKIDTSLLYPFERFNDEVIFHVETPTFDILAAPKCKIDTLLLRSYETNDLRKILFFEKNNDGSYGFKGNYSGSSQLFSGLAINEVFLIQAESNIRLGNVEEGIEGLNTLLLNRYVENSFSQLQILDSDEALEVLLFEKRKELIMRDTRWADLRRLNNNPKTEVTVKRVINGMENVLLPNDVRYVFPIPLKVVQMTGIEQNTR